jgi:hypothetical protein
LKILADDVTRFLSLERIELVIFVFAVKLFILLTHLNSLSIHCPQF